MNGSPGRRGFTLIEIMVSLMIFVVVSGAMVGIMLMSSELFRRGEFSRAANDEVVAVLGAVSDDLNHLVPETGDGWFFAGVPSASGNTLVAYATAGQNPDGIGARGQNSRSLVGTWVEEPTGQEPRLRRIVLDDSRDVLDFISSLVISSGVGGQIVTGFDNLAAEGYDSDGNSTGQLAGCRPGPPRNTDWFGRIIMRALANQPSVADIAFTGRYNWRVPTGTGGGSNNSGGTADLSVVIPSSVLTQGCLHFSAWLALNDIPGMQRPKTLDERQQPDWEQLDANGGTRLGPWGPAINNGSDGAEVYDTRPQGWIPPTANVARAIPKPPFPSAIRLSFVLTGGGRFSPRGTLQSDLENSAQAGDLRYTGITGLPSLPGSMVRVGDEWIAYQRNAGGRLYFETHSPELGPGRGARRSRVAAHARGATLRVGQSYSLVRAIPR
ncbi:MAG: prepilin-type N-terminal cleavage/methylation domain-containing protein [Planctomycetes bacterium]|nr:prepilin-type N-terminal cleavage/methylation domain-containing protein [Planctomycetota bacterium]